jgi:serine/threonine protein kinase/tetratricopeptide (TPR) repeat protein
VVDESVAGVVDCGHPAGVLTDFGDYELLEEIGRGGQGVVYRARQKSLNRIVALKVIGLGQWATQAHLKRFRREAEAAANLDHPCIVPIYDVGEREGSCYFSMKFIDGGQLDEVASRTPISTRNAAELIAKLARTIHYAHEHGILHRDIKPGNILLDAKGEPHLTDFGLARLLETKSSVTHTMDVLGTPSHMAPEQASGHNEQLTSATDVYGLGAVFYQLLTDHPPFAGETTYETVWLVLETEPRQPRLSNPKIDRELSTICLKCLEKDPQRRYSSTLALAEDLEHWLKHEPIRAKRSGFFTRARKWVRRKPAIAALIASLVALAAAAGWIVWKSEFVQLPTTTEKSIAVLPFENLSRDPDNSYFADSVQDAILTNLARIADLKVIGRTSVMQYRSGVTRNLREIGQQLGVAYVVEGKVQRTANHVRVNVQVLDARTDRHLWDHTYDGDLKDIFAIQSAIAKTIADQLWVKLSPSERIAIERPPTSDFAAFSLYTAAHDLFLAASLRLDNPKKYLLQSADLLNQALALDPAFFQAYCLLAWVHDLLYFLGLDHSPARLALAEAAIQAAFRLRPGAGETHLARAVNLYYGYLDYDGALAELEVARQTLPNDARIFLLKGYALRRQGRWEESTRNLERSAELDPRNLAMLHQIAESYRRLRRYTEAKLACDRQLSIDPNEVGAKAQRAFVDFHCKADTRLLHQLVDSIRANNPAATEIIADGWLTCALAERNAAVARDALMATQQDAPLTINDAFHFNRPFVEGLIARMVKDDEKASSAFTTARVEQEKIVEAQQNYGPAVCVLGLIDAALGRKEEALREARRATELLPVERDAINGPLIIGYSAMIAAWLGEQDLACEQLATAIRLPSAPSYGELKLLPFWDPLRGDPRFEQIVASLAPKEN